MSLKQRLGSRFRTIKTFVKEGWTESIVASIGVDVHFSHHMSTEDQKSFRWLTILTHLSLIAPVCGGMTLLYVAFSQWWIAIWGGIFFYLFNLNLHRILNSDLCFPVFWDPHKVELHYRLEHLLVLRMKVKDPDIKERHERKIQYLHKTIDELEYLLDEPKVKLRRVNLMSIVVLLLFSTLLSHALVIYALSPCVEASLYDQGKQSAAMLQTSGLYPDLTPEKLNIMFSTPQITGYFKAVWTEVPELATVLTILSALIGLLPTLLRMRKNSLFIFTYAYTVYLFRRTHILQEYQHTQMIIKAHLDPYSNPLRTMIENPWLDPPFNRRLRPQPTNFLDGEELRNILIQRSKN